MLCSHAEWLPLRRQVKQSTVKLSSPGNDSAVGHMALNCSFMKKKASKEATWRDFRCSVLWVKLPFCLLYLWLNFLFVQCLEWMCGVTQIMMPRSLKEWHWSNMNGLSILSVVTHLHVNGYQYRLSLVLDKFIYKWLLYRLKVKISTFPGFYYFYFKNLFDF